MTKREALVDSRFCDLERQFATPADELVSAVIVALQDYDTETLRGIADYREAIHPGCWTVRMIREYVSVWR